LCFDCDRRTDAQHPECLLYGQDVGWLEVFFQKATLAQKFGEDRVSIHPSRKHLLLARQWNVRWTKPLLSSVCGLYLAGLNQLSRGHRSCYLTNENIRFHVLRYRPGRMEVAGLTTLPVWKRRCAVLRLKVVYPSNGADLKGLIKAAYYDPNPVVIFEHKGLYWSKVAHTETAKCPLPDEAYIVPIGKGRIVVEAREDFVELGQALCIVTYGMVHWALSFEGEEGLIWI
jgi:2-oxoisovalerate dehydrogenase E1 component